MVSEQSRKVEKMAKKNPLKNRWYHMLEKCYTPSHRQYPNYGGRGIGVCEEWRTDFAKFEAWSLANGYSNELEIGRLDVTKDYSPENCRYATPQQQSSVRRTCRVETYNGVTASMVELCRHFGKDYNLVRRRMTHGWTIKDAFETNRARPHNGTYGTQASAR